MDYVLRYEEPGRRWFDALPLGNGRVGAMVYGGVGTERIDLSEVTCWSGEPSAANNQQGAGRLLAQVRKLLLSGRHAEAERLAEGMIGLKRNYGTNLPFGVLTIGQPIGERELTGVTGYERSLDLGTATAEVVYLHGGVRYRRTVFVSHPHQVLVVRLAADAPRAVSCVVSLAGEGSPLVTAPEGSQEIVASGSARETMHSDGTCGVDLHARLRVVATGGTVTHRDGGLRVSGSDQVLILVALGTTFGGNDMTDQCRRQIAAAGALRFEEIHAAHVADHRRLFDRVTLEMGEGAVDALPASRRLSRRSAPVARIRGSPPCSSTTAGTF